MKSGYHTSSGPPNSCHGNGGLPFHQWPQVGVRVCKATVCHRGAGPLALGDCNPAKLGKVPRGRQYTNSETLRGRVRTTHPISLRVFTNGPFHEQNPQQAALRSAHSRHQKGAVKAPWLLAFLLESSLSSGQSSA